MGEEARGRNEGQGCGNVDRQLRLKQANSLVLSPKLEMLPQGSEEKLSRDTLSDTPFETDRRPSLLSMLS